MNFLNNFSIIKDEEGNSVYKEEQIAKVIVSYFHKIFTSKEGNREHTVNFALQSIITEEVNHKLIATPSAEEIKKVVFSIHADKAPGPDGFSASFFHTNWSSIGAKIVLEFREFFNSGILLRAINETHIRLKPKTHGPRKVSEYRPIALCNLKDNFQTAHQKIATGVDPPSL